MTENVPGERLQSERSSAAFGSPLCPVDSVDSVDQARQVWHHVAPGIRGAFHRIHWTSFNS